MTATQQNGHKLRVSKTTLEEIDARITGLETLLGRTATRADVMKSERRIIEHIDRRADELLRAIEWEESPSGSV